MNLLHKQIIGSGSAVLTLSAFATNTDKTATTAVPSKPNIIVIMADDLGNHDVGFQGATFIKTPNIDKLAHAGMIFTDGHVSAGVCSPSRAGFMTGRNQQRFGHEANCPHGKEGMDTSEFTLGQAMKKEGYTTAIFGKWHLGDLDKQSPNKRGFDEFWGFRDGSHNYWYKSVIKKKGKKRKKRNPVMHNNEKIPFDGYLTDWIGEKACEFINSNAEKTFFMFVAFNAPHGPLQAKPEDLKKFKNNKYAAMIWSLDEAVGKIVKTLEKNKLMDNTMIWFLSDNGGTCEQASNGKYNGKKGTLFEGGMRVPFFLYWKPVIKPGSVYNKPISSLDIFPTSVAVAGGNPAKNPKPLDGVNLIPYLTGKNKGLPNKKLNWRRLNIAASRNGDWKLIRVDNKYYALYNLKNDVGEMHNRIKENPEKAEELKKQLTNWEKGLIAPLWDEGEKWDKWRTKFHLEVFKGKKMMQMH